MGMRLRKKNLALGGADSGEAFGSKEPSGGLPWLTGQEVMRKSDQKTSWADGQSGTWEMLLLGASLRSALHLLFFLGLAVCCLRNLSFPTRDQTQTLSSENTESPRALLASHFLRDPGLVLFPLYLFPHLN